MIVQELEVSESQGTQANYLFRAARSLNVIKSSRSWRQVSSGAMSIEETKVGHDGDGLATQMQTWREQEDKNANGNKLNIIVSDPNQLNMMQPVSSKESTNNRRRRELLRNQTSAVYSRHSLAGVTQMKQTVHSPGRNQAQVMLDRKKIQLQAAIQYQQTQPQSTRKSSQDAVAISSQKSSARRNRRAQQNQEELRKASRQAQNMRMSPSGLQSQERILKEHTTGNSPRDPNAVPKKKDKLSRDGKVKSALSTIGFNMKTETDMSDQGALRGNCDTKDMFKTHDNSRLSQNMDQKSARRRSHVVDELGSPLAARRLRNKLQHPVRQAVNSAYFNAEDQEQLLEQALQQHRLSQHHSIMLASDFKQEQTASELQHRRSINNPDDFIDQQLQRMVLKTQGSMGASRINNNRLVSEFAKTMQNTNPSQASSKQASNPSTWLPQTQQFIQDLIQSQHGWSPKKSQPNNNFLGPSQLLSTHQRRKPFQLKSKTQTGPAINANAVLQGNRDSMMSRLNNETSTGEPSNAQQQQSALSTAQPFNVLQSAANQCFSSNKAHQQNAATQGVFPAQQPLQNHVPITLEKYDSILVKGIRQGLQPQFGRAQNSTMPKSQDPERQYYYTATELQALSQLAATDPSKIKNYQRYQPVGSVGAPSPHQAKQCLPAHCSDEISSMCALPKRAADALADKPMMRTSTGFHIQQRQSMDSQHNHNSNANRQLSKNATQLQGRQQKGNNIQNGVLCASLLNQSNSNQIQTYLMQHGQGDYQSQIVDPNSYLTVPKNFTSAQKELKEAKAKVGKSPMQPYSHGEKKSQSKAQPAQAQRKPAELTGKGEERLISQFTRYQLEQERFAERILQEESIAMHQYHQLLQREIDKLRVMQSGVALGYSNKKHAPNGGQGVSTPSVKPLPIQKSNNALKQQNVKGNNNPGDQQRSLPCICANCHGIVVQDLNKLAQYAENFLICQCSKDATSLQQVNTGHSSRDTSPLPQIPAELQTFSDVNGFVASRQPQHQDKVKVQNGAISVTPQGHTHGMDSPELTRLEQLKQMQMRLLNSQPRSNKKARINMALQGPVLGNQAAHRRNKGTISGDDSACNTLTQSSISKSRQEGADLAHLKTVIKFYQNNMVHENPYLRQKGIECKGQTIGGLIMNQPLGCALQEARKLQALQERDRRLHAISRTGVATINFQQPHYQHLQGSSSPVGNILQKLPAELTYLAMNDRKLRNKAKSSNVLQVQANLAKNVRQRASIELDYEQSEHRRVPQSDVNLFLQQINEFVRVTLKFKETITQAHLAQIRRLGRQIGLKFGNVKELDAKFINSKDFVAILKSKIFCMLNFVVMRAADNKDGSMVTAGVGNGAARDHQSATENQTSQQKTFKFYVEPSGNNHMIVRSVIKRRSWYSSQELSQEHGWSGQGPKMLNLIWTQVRRQRILRELQPYQIYNHIDGINEISQKSLLFVNMRSYYTSKGLNVFDFMPETYMIPSTTNFELHAQFKAFKAACQQGKIKGQLWIFKPGESTNRGHGIRVFNDYDKVKAHMQEFCRHAENRRGQGRNRNCILQRYIMRPLLISKRKFDIRVFALIVAHADTGLIRGYFYEEGYLRTSSKDFNIDKWDNRLIHLTNDAVQKNSADYGKYESANKISYQDFDKHLLKEKNVSFLQTIVPKIKDMVTDVLEASGRALYRPETSHEGVSRSEDAVNYNAFELMGFDFMLDSDLKLNLIEVNTNPCLDTPCMLLQRIVPTVLDQTLKIAVDPFLQANEHQYYMTQDLTVSEMKFQLVYQDSMELALRDQLQGNEAKLATEQQQQQQSEPKHTRGLSNDELTPLKTANLVSNNSLTPLPIDEKRTCMTAGGNDADDVVKLGDLHAGMGSTFDEEANDDDSFQHQQSTESPIKIQPNPNEPE